MSNSDRSAPALALGLGAIAGARSMSAPAWLCRHIATGGAKLPDSPLYNWAGSRTGARIVALAALGEMVADKLPFVPNRIAPLPLAGRMASGALVGSAVFAEEHRPPLAGAAIGGAAVLSTYITYLLRRWVAKKLGIPGPLVGLVGDALVTAGGYALTKE